MNISKRPATMENFWQELDVLTASGRIAQKSGRCVLLLASPDFCPAAVQREDYVIACDAGYLYAEKFGICPDLVLGDFDSFTGTVDSSLPVLHAPVMKDDTDAMLAIKVAFRLGYKEFLLLGATGGRLDHTLANLTAAAYIAEQGGRCELRDGATALYAFRNGRILLSGMNGRTVSVFSWKDEARGVSIRGMRYPLENTAVTNGFPLGVSNVVTADEAQVEVQNGLLFFVVPDPAEDMIVRFETV